MSTQHRILVLLSDPVLRRNCCDSLVARQLIAEEAQNTAAALDKLATHPDIALAIIGAPDSSQTLQMSQALIERNANLQLLLLPPAPVELANLSRQITVLEDSETAAHIVEKVEQLLGSAR